MESHSTFIHRIRQFWNLSSREKILTLVSFERNRTTSFPIYIYSSLLHVHSFTVRFIALSFHGAVVDRRHPLLKETRSTASLHGQWATTTLPIRANIFEKCIDVITKQVFTSFHSRFTSGIHRKHPPPWIWHSGSGAKRSVFLNRRQQQKVKKGRRRRSLWGRGRGWKLRLHLSFWSYLKETETSRSKEVARLR